MRAVAFRDYGGCRILRRGEAGRMEKGGLVKDTCSSRLTPDTKKYWKLPKRTDMITSIPKELRAGGWGLGGCSSRPGGVAFPRREGV